MPPSPPQTKMFKSEQGKSAPTQVNISSSNPAQNAPSPPLSKMFEENLRASSLSPFLDSVQDYNGQVFVFVGRSYDS